MVCKVTWIWVLEIPPERGGAIAENRVSGGDAWPEDGGLGRMGFDELLLLGISCEMGYTSLGLMGLNFGFLLANA